MKKRTRHIVIATIACLVGASAALLAQTGGGATLVGTVRDSTGATVAGAKVTVVNTETAFVTETTTKEDGGYYLPYLAPGNYRLKVAANGFKEYLREGLSFRSADVPRLDVGLELGSMSESVTVQASVALINTENVLSSYVIPKEVLAEVPGVMKRTVYLMQYMPGVVGVVGQAGFHIAGQAQNDIGATLDGVVAKSPYTGVVNQVDGVIQGSTDAMEEVKVLTTGVSAEYGHSAGGSMKMVYKSGANQLHVTFEDRYLPGSWVHRNYITQFPLPASAPWYYETFDLVASGPIVIPKLYNGRNKTFWLSDYAINHEHTINQTINTVPSPEMLNGDFSFPNAPGGGFPLYDPASTRLVNGVWTRDPIPGNIIPKARFDPVAVKFLSIGIWQTPNQPGSYSRSGPANNLLFNNTCRCLHRDRWDEKIDHQFSPNQKIYFRYSQGHHRGQNGDAFAKADYNASREIAPTDDINGVISHTSIISSRMFNEFRVGYNRRATSNPIRPDVLKDTLGIPGIPAETFPFFNIGYSIAAMGYNREVGEDRVLQDNLTRIVGKHSVKIGYEMIRTLYSRKDTSLPSGQYNFTGGTSLPFTPNTGIDFASFLLGAVTSATFTKQFAIFMPRMWDHELYIQDDWKISPKLSLNLGLRWMYQTPFRTKYDQQSQFDPDAVDPLTGLKGAITHPQGAIGTRDLNNFQPRVGVAYNFTPKWVFRTSFGIMTIDNSGPGGFDEYVGNFNILQPTGDPRTVFQLSAGPGDIRYPVNADGTVSYTGASFGNRTATLRDPNLRNPYVINWSAGFQGQLSHTWTVSLMHQGTSGVGLTRNWNINTIPLSIALGGDRALQDRVFTAQQNYLYYPQFGTINYLSNFNHNTWHSGNITVDKRYSNGLTVQVSYNISKSLSNDDSLTYYNRQGKARTSYDQRHQFGAFVIYDLPIGRGKRFLNRGGVLNAVFGGWKVDVSENALSGQPISITHAGSPNKYLTTSRVNTTAPIESAKVSGWDMGQRFPTAAQTPYFNIGTFAYPDSYTIGTLGSRVLQAPALLWMQYFATKSWTVRERYKLSVRVDGHNLPWKRPNLAAPNTTYNLSNTAAWGKFTGVVGDFSNFGTAQANTQLAFRVEF